MLTSLRDMCGPYPEPEEQTEEAQEPTEQVNNGTPQLAASSFSACMTEINDPRLLRGLSQRYHWRAGKGIMRRE